MEAKEKEAFKNMQAYLMPCCEKAARRLL